jgi:predicted nucleotidyltransferase
VKCCKSESRPNKIHSVPFMLKQRFREIEKKLLEEIKSFYREQLISVVLFGSAARETQSFDSNIDILIIARELPKGRIKRIREFESVEEEIEPHLKSLKEEGINTYISAVIKSPQEAKKGSPLFFDMVEDAKIIFDRDDFFHGVMTRLKDRLTALGAERVWKGNTW